MIGISDLAALALPGSLVRAFVPCNKGRCRCTRGRGHGPKWYLMVGSHGPPATRYVRAELLERVRQGVRCHRTLKKRLKAILRKNIGQVFGAPRGRRRGHARSGGRR